MDFTPGYYPSAPTALFLAVSPFRGFAPVPWVLPTAVVLRTYGALYGAQQRFSVTGDFWGDVSEETDYIFTKYRLVYIINFVDLWSK